MLMSLHRAKCCDDPTEACCLPDETCQQLTPKECQAMGGTPQGPGTLCTPNLCVVTQACCFPNGSCTDVSPSACKAAGGTPQGPGTECATTTCPVPGPCGCLGDACPDTVSFEVDVTRGDCNGPFTFYTGTGTLDRFPAGLPPADQCRYVFDIDHGSANVFRNGDPWPMSQIILRCRPDFLPDCVCPDLPYWFVLFQPTVFGVTNLCKFPNGGADCGQGLYEMIGTFACICPDMVHGTFTVS